MASLVKTSSNQSMKSREDSSLIIHFLSSSNNTNITNSSSKSDRKDKMKIRDDVKVGG